MKPKLILVEGLPGNGKTTIAKFIKGILEEKDVQSSLFNEGNLDHPVDFESVACLGNAEYQNLILKFEVHRDFLEKQVVKKGDDYYLSYKKMKRTGNISNELFRDLAKYEVYDLPLKKYCLVCKEKWQEFVVQAEKNSETYIFECCFFQNPLNVLLARDNVNPECIKEYIMDLAEVISRLNPILIYLYQNDIKATLERVIPERSEQWLEQIIHYFTAQMYGKVNHLSGFAGAVKFCEARRELEIELFKMLGLRKLFIDNSDRDWNRIQREISNFLIREFV